MDSLDPWPRGPPSSRRLSARSPSRRCDGSGPACFMAMPSTAKYARRRCNRRTTPPMVPPSCRAKQHRHPRSRYRTPSECRTGLRRRRARFHPILRQQNAPRICLKRCRARWRSTRRSRRQPRMVDRALAGERRIGPARIRDIQRRGLSQERPRPVAAGNAKNVVVDGLRKTQVMRSFSAPGMRQPSSWTARPCPARKSLSAISFPSAPKTMRPCPVWSVTSTGEHRARDVGDHELRRRWASGADRPFAQRTGKDFGAGFQARRDRRRCSPSRYSSR